jgi:hypothetical protein
VETLEDRELAMVEAEHLLRGMAALLWPLIAIAVLILFRPTVMAIIDSAKSRKFTLKLGGQELAMDQAIGQIDEKIRTLQIVTKGIVTDFEYEKLRNLANDGPFLVSFHWDMYHELKRLDAIRYIEPQQGHGINSLLERDGSGAAFDLKQFVKITQEGLGYIRVRDEILQVK